MLNLHKVKGCSCEKFYFNSTDFIILFYEEEDSYFAKNFPNLDIVDNREAFIYYLLFKIIKSFFINKHISSFDYKFICKFKFKFKLVYYKDNLEEINNLSW
jgi:hypothetical protein